MATVAAPGGRLRASRRGRVGRLADERGGPKAWTRGDTLLALGWMALAMLGRACLAARIEGMLDHDQGVVGLMALDIAAGRRWPIFFDGQRYMGAIEAYTAAVFVRLLGHSPAVVALAPLLYFGLFVAGQYAAWRLWSGRASGHLAALLAAIGSPMLALWSIAPRGGYSELLAWAMPVLVVYRALTRPEAGPRSRAVQAGWGFLLALGFFVNPLSLIVYTTLLVDWLLGRHGAALRREPAVRRPSGRRFDWPRTIGSWAVVGLAGLTLLAAGCHVALGSASDEPRYVWALDLLPGLLGVALGGLMMAALLILAAWRTGLGRRLSRLLMDHPWSAVGIVGALLPFLLYNLRVRLGFEPRGLSLPIWIRAPWGIGPNVLDGLYALRPLVGCDAHAAAFSVVGQYLKTPPPTWPWLGRGLALATPPTVGLVLVLVGTAAWRDRSAWRAFWSLRGRGPSRPTVLALIGLSACLGLYLFQATSANSTSIRYLLPAWIFLPGLLARGLLAWPRPARLTALVLLVGLWSAAQGQLWADMGQPSPVRPVAEELERRGVKGFVASTNLVLLVGDLTQGRIGGVEYHSYWPRLHDRYADRFEPGRPIICVNDLEYGRPAIEDLGLRLRQLAGRHPGRVRRTWRRGQYEIWEADLPLAEILAWSLDPQPEARPRAESASGPCPPGRDRRR